MEQYRGLHAADGIAFGRVKRIEISYMTAHKWDVENTDAEIARFEEARLHAVAELQNLLQVAGTRLDASDLGVFQGWILMVQDCGFVESVKSLIVEEHVNAEYAVHCALEQYSQVLSRADELYMRERVADIREVEERILRSLARQDQQIQEIAPGSIIVSEDLTPEYMVRLDREKIAAFVMAAGSVRSHAAIMARIMGVPAVVGLGSGILQCQDGTQAAVDGETGEVFLVPDENTKMRLEEKQQLQIMRRTKLQKYVTMQPVTRNGIPAQVFANISSEEELKQVKENGGAGVGLFRSEWLYLERNTYPSEEMQFVAYSKVLKEMEPARVVIRTLDAGGDKKADYMEFPKEDNPVLGLRGIRVCFAYPDIFKTQLRALYRASVYGNLAILFPMIISVEEVKKIRQMIQQVQEELTREKKAFRKVPLGIMVETPAAALLSEELAEEVDFFSIGTNDLTQYTLAADRQNTGMELYYNSTHPAVMRLIQMTADSANRHNISVCVCGELGGDLQVTQQLLDMGITNFSVNPPQILPLKEKLMNCE